MTKNDPAERLEAMLRIRRRFEEQCSLLSEDGKFPGRYHVHIGQEATAVTAAHNWARTTSCSDRRDHGHRTAWRAAFDRMMAAEILDRGGRPGAQTMPRGSTGS